MDVGGCGNIVENNRIEGHVHSRRGDTGTCNVDDGNGMDFKGSGNRMYWTMDATGDRVLMDLPNVVRNNVITRNAGKGMVIHAGADNIHIYNNEFSYNTGTDGSAIHIKAGQLLDGLLEDDYRNPGRGGGAGGGMVGFSTMMDTGPALTQNIYVYRNMIYRNGYSEDNFIAKGANAVRLEEEGNGLYHGSFKSVWLVNNTIANNVGYGLKIWLDSTSTSKDATSYAMDDVYVMNNVFSYNSPVLPDTAGLQVLLNDELYKPGTLRRGFFCSLEMRFNGYQTDRSDRKAVRIQGKTPAIDYTLSEFKEYNIELNAFCSGMSVHRFLPLGFDSVEVSGTNQFVDTSLNDYRLSLFSLFIDAGTDVSKIRHYEGQVWITDGPDFDYSKRVTFEKTPNMGADE